MKFYTIFFTSCVDAPEPQIRAEKAASFPCVDQRGAERSLSSEKRKSTNSELVITGEDELCRALAIRLSNLTKNTFPSNYEE